VVCVVTAGCSLPDLTVTAAYKGWSCTSDGFLVLNLEPWISNKGTANAVLPNDWTKPWITAYADPAAKLPPYVRPYQTCTGGVACPFTLEPNGSVTVPMKILLPPAPGGSEYKVIVEADPNKAIQETNEDNNTDYVPIPAKVCG
jgi:hypothetical protein